MKLSFLTAALSILGLTAAAELKTPETSAQFEKFVDPVSGAVSYLLKPGAYGWNQQSLYFVTKSMTDDGRFLVFSVSGDERQGKQRVQRWVFDFEKDAAFPIPNLRNGSIYLDVQTAELYQISLEGIYRRNLKLDLAAETRLCPLPDELKPQNPSNYYRLATHLTPSADRKRFFLDTEVNGRTREGVLNVETGKFEQWSEARFCCNHGQLNPVDPDLGLCAWEYGRSLVVDELGRPRTDDDRHPKTANPYVTRHPRPHDWVYPRVWLCHRTTGLEMIAPLVGNYATHENFTANGEGLYWCSTGVTYCDLKTRRQRCVVPIAAQHATMTRDLNYVTYDCSRNGWWRGCQWTCMFYNRNTHRWCYIYSVRPILAPRDQQSRLHPDPHPQFVCRDRYVVSTMIGDDRRMNLCVTPVAGLIALTSDPRTAPKPVRLPVAWPANGPTGRPYEMEVDNGRLCQQGSLEQPNGNYAQPPSAFALEATVNGAPQRVPLTALPGNNTLSLRLRFVPPAGTTALTLIGDVSERFEVEDSIGCDNLLAAALKATNLSRWTAKAPDGQAECVRDGVRVTASASLAWGLPAEAAGRQFAFELDYRMLTTNAFAQSVRLRQFDRLGRELGDCIPSGRLSQIRPNATTRRLRLSGAFDPAAVRVELNFDCTRCDDGTAGALLVSHLALRLAEPLEFAVRDPLTDRVFGQLPDFATPEVISQRLTDQFLRTRPEHYCPPGYRGNGYANGGYGGGTHVQYSIVSIWVNALECARKLKRHATVERLVRLYDDFLPGGAKHSICSGAYHVDDTIFGSIPLTIFLQNGDRRHLNEGIRYADTQWSPPCEASIKARHAISAELQQQYWSQGYTPQTRLWIDDMYMIIALQSQAYRATGERKYIDRAAKEMCLYLDRLQLRDGNAAGLFYHAPDVPFVWGRGDGWMAAGMTLVLKYLPKQSEYRSRILAGYRQMMATLLKYQRPSGKWCQLINEPDDPQNWEESSSSAMFTYAFIVGVRHGWLDAKVYGPAARKAWIALCESLDEHGNVPTVCCGTGKRNDRQYYFDRIRVHGDPHGQAPMLWCADALLD